MKAFFAKVISFLGLIWRRVIADNFTDSNGDTDIVRILATCAVIEGLIKYSSGKAGVQDLVLLLGGLGTAWAAKKADPKK